MGSYEAPRHVRSHRYSVLAQNVANSVRDEPHRSEFEQAASRSRLTCHLPLAGGDGPLHLCATNGCDQYVLRNPVHVFFRLVRRLVLVLLVLLVPLALRLVLTAILEE